MSLNSSWSNFRSDGSGGGDDDGGGGRRSDDGGGGNGDVHGDGGTNGCHQLVRYRSELVLLQ